MPLDPAWPTLDVTTEAVGSGDELAVSIGFTHDISPIVCEYLKDHSEVGRMIVAGVYGGSSGGSVRSGSHAMMLAEGIVAAIRWQPPTRMLHLFIAASNGFTFFLGQHQPVLGSTTTYEWDFEGKQSHTYSKGLVLR